jgi:hypothetical protein
VTREASCLVLLEEGDGKAVLLADVGDGLLLQEVKSEQGDLLSSVLDGNIEVASFQALAR